MSVLYDVGRIFQIFAPQLLKDLRPYWVRFTFGLTNIELSLNAYGHCLHVNMAFEVSRTNFVNTFNPLLAARLV